MNITRYLTIGITSVYLALAPTNIYSTSVPLDKILKRTTRVKEEPIILKETEPIFLQTDSPPKRLKLPINKTLEDKAYRGLMKSLGEPLIPPKR